MFALVDIYDTDEDHEVGGQDVPYLVTVKVDGVSIPEALNGNFFAKLCPFNINPSKHLGLEGHIEFCTFSFNKDIQRFFGIEPEKTADDMAEERYFRSVYAKTVGELRAAIADLPDDFPLVHTEKKVGSENSIESFNALGIHIQTGAWIFEGPRLPVWGTHQWSLRLSEFGSIDWGRIMQGTWSNRLHVDIAETKRGGKDAAN